VSLRYFGLEAFRRAIERSLELAAKAHDRIEASDELELMAPPSLGVVCFRRRFGGLEDEEELDRLNATLISELAASGLGLVSSTRLRASHAIRLCVLSHTTGEEDVERVLDFLEQAEVEDAAATPLARYQRHPGLSTSPPAITPPRFTLLDQLPPAEAERMAALGAPLEVAAGETVVEQWGSSRDFFVIVDGRVEVLVDGERIAELGPGEFFGEIAALDWGAGFGYPRIAQVVAATPLRLLVYPDGSLQLIIRDFSVVERVIRAAVTYRLSVR
jgi:hypothetical protein